MHICEGDDNAREPTRPMLLLYGPNLQKKLREPLPGDLVENAINRIPDGRKTDLGTDGNSPFARIPFPGSKTARSFIVVLRGDALRFALVPLVRLRRRASADRQSRQILRAKLAAQLIPYGFLKLLSAKVMLAVELMRSQDQGVASRALAHIDKIDKSLNCCGLWFQAWDLIYVKPPKVRWWFFPKHDTIKRR